MIKVALLLYPGARNFDVAVIQEAFRPHRASAPSLPVELQCCAACRGTVELSDGVGHTAQRTLTWLRGADLVLVPGLVDPAHLPGEPELAALRGAHARNAQVASLCAGAFVLAAAGLLDGREATTHWALAPRLAATYPGITVRADALYIRSGRVWTSAGVAAGIDLCLALLRAEFGAGIAGGIARSLVAAPHREGGQAQFTPVPVPDAAGPVGLAAAASAAFELDPAHPWSVDELAARAHVSPRTFARRFAQQAGTTPHQWLIAARIDRARMLLETSDLSVEQVAAAVGMGSAATLRAAFTSAVGVAPGRYRAAFAARPTHARPAGA